MAATLHLVGAPRGFGISPGGRQLPVGRQGLHLWPLPERAKRELVPLKRSRGRQQFFARGTLDSLPATAAPREGPLPKTWSNPRGEVLTEVVPGVLWTADRPFVWNGIDVGGRMGVVRLRDGSLWVHSPVELDASLAAALEALGPVGHIVSPNCEHCKYAQQWIEAYPEATGYACPGLQEQRPDIRYSAVVGLENSAPEAWDDEFEVTFLDCEKNPFSGEPFFNEVVFVHKPSKALFVTDYFWNYPESGLPFQSAAWKLGMDRIFLPFYSAFMVTDKNLLKSRLDQVLAADWNTLVPCHGTVVTRNAKQVLASHVQLK